MSQSPRPVAIINDGSFYVGPPLARALASSGFDLVVGDPAEGLVSELESLGASVVTVSQVRDLTQPENPQKLVQAALDAFGRIDSAVMFSGLIVTGSILKSSREDL
ncbi:MAG: 3-ketoacyl-ACP reductase, partial [Actinobacteria bacterium]|nr:3-ketoacyl-ACP reductase [Actinomycetota bacterium]